MFFFSDGSTFTKETDRVMNSWQRMIEGLVASTSRPVFCPIRYVSKVVSTHLWNTPLNLYQQAMKGFLSWLTRGFAWGVLYGCVVIFLECGFPIFVSHKKQLPLAAASCTGVLSMCHEGVNWGSGILKNLDWGFWNGHDALWMGCFIPWLDMLDWMQTSMIVFFGIDQVDGMDKMSWILLGGIWYILTSLAVNQF